MRRLLFTLCLLATISCQGPASTPSSAAPASATASALLSGKVALDDKVKGSADPLAVLFIIARNEQGQIVAVKKLLPPFQWPVEFSLAEEDIMIAGTELSGKLKLTARLDKDGNANPVSSGDILGATSTEWVKPGDREIGLTLTELAP